MRHPARDSLFGRVVLAILAFPGAWKLAVDEPKAETAELGSTLP
jgi:hypothetical protein